MKKKISRAKINPFFILIFFFAFFIAIIKLVYVAMSPTVDGIDLTAFANKRDIVKKTLYASRGNIYDTNGEIIAQNVNSYTLIAYLSDSRTTDPKNPKHVVDKTETAKKLAECLELEYDYVLSRLNYNGYQVEFGPKGKNLSENKKAQIEALNLPGLDFIVGSKRYYKKSKMASYIVGYARSNDEGEITGEMGIESYYNDILKGENGETIYKKDGAGYKIGDAITKDPVKGSDIYLTIDSGIQLILEDAFHTLEENYHFEWATLSVMNAKTGAIVGSVSTPNFNPNTLEGLTSFVNPLVGYQYEPGSTMKIFSWLAAMENKKYNGEEEFMSGSIKVAGANIQDFNKNGWGSISYDTGFAYSSNVGATKLALRLGSSKLLEFYESLGFGKKTGIELPGETKGILKMTYESELASASFGQGITTTPIQTLQALSILTNNGVMLKPYIVDKIVNEKGEVTYEGKRTELGEKVSSASVSKMRELMHDVVYNGLSKTWQTNNIEIAGKTGTAEIASQYGGYLTGQNDYIRSFAGIFPYENPEYIFYISVKQIDGGATGVAKTTKQVVESIANYANLTVEENVLDTSKIIKLANYQSENVEETKNTLTNNFEVITIGTGANIIKQYPTPNTEVESGSKIFLLTDSDKFLMPNVIGWSSSEIMTFCNLIGLKYTFNGYGRVTSVNISSNEIIDLTKTLEITLST